MDSTQMGHGGGQAKLLIGFTHFFSQIINLIMGKFLHTKNVQSYNLDLYIPYEYFGPLGTSCTTWTHGIALDSWY